MKNPWEEIDLTAYETHMSLDSVFQLQAMNQMMREQFDAHPVRSIMILGVAGGNGLEHIDLQRVDKVYGVDINEAYLQACQQRYPRLRGVLEPIRADLTGDAAVLPHTELLVANLFIEYIGYGCFQRTVRQVEAPYVSCIIQINTGASFVSDSPYLHAFDRLEEVLHPMEEDALVSAMGEIGYEPQTREARSLPNGKKLLRIDFQRGRPADESPEKCGAAVL